MISLNENVGGRATTLADVEALAREFSEEHKQLSLSVACLDAELDAIKRKHLPEIRREVAAAARAKLALHTAVAGSPGLFERPRTQMFHGIKVGFQKGKGGIDWDDSAKVVALIRKVYGVDGDAFIRTTEEPDKRMLADMPVSELKRIGCTVADAGDQVVIKPIDGEVEKIVAALLKDVVETEVKG